MHAKSTGELISFGFSDHSVRSLFGLSDRAQLIAESKQKKRLHFLADLWSQSEFRTQRKTDPKSEMTQYQASRQISPRSPFIAHQHSNADAR